MSAVVYALVDPVLDEVIYVGQSTSEHHARLRFLAHQKPYGKNNDKQRWVRWLQKHGMRPKLRILEYVPHVPVTALDEAEQRHIAALQRKGEALTNQRHAVLCRQDRLRRLAEFLPATDSALEPH